MGHLPVAEGLFTGPADEPRLIGGRCRSCGTITFPKQGSCPRCTGSEVEEHLLDRRGTLWTFTVQGFPPKPPYAGPEAFTPYGVGYVELAGQVLVESRLTEHDPARLAIGAEMELVIVPFRRDDSGNDVVTFAFRPVTRGVSTLESRSSASESTRSGATTACRDSGRARTRPGRRSPTRVSSGATSSLRSAAARTRGNADTLVGDLGLTGLPFVNVANGCATGGSALIMSDTTIRSGAYEFGIAIGFDKHPRGAFNADPEAWGLGHWYGETGLMLTTQFFAMKTQRYLHDHGIPPSTLATVAAKAFRNGSRNPNAWRRTPLSEQDVARVADDQPPVDAVHVLLARRGRRRARPVPRRPGPPVHRPARLPQSRDAAITPVRVVRSVQPVARRRARRQPDGRRVARGLRASGDRTRTRSTSPRCRTPTPAPR